MPAQMTYKKHKTAPTIKRCARVINALTYNLDVFLQGAYHAKMIAD